MILHPAIQRIMNPRQPSDPDRKTFSAFRQMGMALSIFGTVVLSTGLVAHWRDSEDHQKTLSFSLVAVGVAMLIAGTSIWRNTKGRDPS